MDTTEKSLVVQSNVLINNRYELSLPEIRIILCALASFEKGRKELGTVAIPFHDLYSLAKVTSVYNGAPKDGDDEKIENYLGIREIIKSLGKRYIECYVKKDSGDYGWELIFWLSYAYVSIPRRIVFLDFNKFLTPYLLNLKENFTQAELGVLLKLRSYPQIRLYLLLKERLHIGWRDFSMEELKDFVGAKGHYPAFGNFKQIILDRAQERFKEVSDIIFTYKKTNVGKKVTHLRFYIEQNLRKKALELILSPEEEMCVNIFLEQMNEQIQKYHIKSIKHTEEQRKDSISKAVRRVGWENWDEMLHIWRDESVTIIIAKRAKRCKKEIQYQELYNYYYNRDYLVQLYYNCLLPSLYTKENPI